MTRSRSCPYRTPRIESWWHPVVDALEPVVELAVIGLALVDCYLMAVLGSVL